MADSFLPVSGTWSYPKYLSPRALYEQSWYLQHHQAQRATCSSAPKHKINKGRAFVFEGFKGSDIQWTARKRNPPDLLGFVKDVYRPVFLIVWCISQKSAAVVFLPQTLLSPGSSGCFLPLFEETPGTPVVLFCSSAKASSNSSWKPCF